MYTMYANASNNTASYTHVSSYMIWRVHPLDILQTTMGPTCHTDIAPIPTFYFLTETKWGWLMGRLHINLYSIILFWSFYKLHNFRFYIHLCSEYLILVVRKGGELLWDKRLIKGNPKFHFVTTLESLPYILHVPHKRVISTTHTCWNVGSFWSVMLSWVCFRMEMGLWWITYACNIDLRSNVVHLNYVIILVWTCIVPAHCIGAYELHLNLRNVTPSCYNLKS